MLHRDFQLFEKLCPLTLQRDEAGKQLSRQPVHFPQRLASMWSVNWGEVWCLPPLGLVLRNPTCHSWMIFLRKKKMEHYRMVWETPSSVFHKYCTQRANLNAQEISKSTVHHAYLMALGFHSLPQLGQRDISISSPLHAYMVLCGASQRDFGATCWS